MSLPEAAAIRKQVLERRRAQPKAAVARISELVSERFISACEIQGFDRARWTGLRVALYRPLPGEFDLAILATWLEDAGARLHFPRTRSTDENPRALEFVPVELKNPRTRWEKGPYGIDEPNSGHPPVAPGELDLIFVPGVAFGMKGERIGMGAGYFDRFLAGPVGALRVALAFDFQIFEELAQNPWDQAMHWIMSESREYRSPRIAAWLKAKA